MGLLSKLGGAVKEGIRKGAVNGLLKATGNNGASGYESYSEYEYDANGHIKGINTEYAAEVMGRFGVNDSSRSSSKDKFGDYYSSGNGLGYAAGGRGTGLFMGKGYISKYPTKFQKNPEQYKFSNYESIYNNAFQSEFNSEKYLGKKNDEKTSHASQSAYNATKNIETVDGLLYRDQLESYKNYNNDGFGVNHRIANDVNSDIYKLKLPDWSYADFINERAIWQKGLSSVLDEPGWFYFKIFFDFNTNHGLFGGLLNNAYLYSATNSASKYLHSVRNLHKNIKARDRILALYKLASILSYINTNAPWYFKSVKGLDKAVLPVLDEFNKEHSIEIETMPDAIDMRLSTIMSLYSYACFDRFYDKEIIPENLRKFNMTIILFQTPLRYLHTSFTTNEKKEFLGINTDQFSFGNKLTKNNNKVYYKNMSVINNNSTNFPDLMSMKVISLYGCEFDKEYLGSMIPGDVSNETPFQLGRSSIKITYTDATEHTMNEFYAMMFGSDGFYFNQYSNFLTDDDNMTGEVNSTRDWQAKQIKRYETLAATFGNLTQGGTILGIIDSPKSYKEAIDATEAIMNGIGESSNLLGDLGVNFALGLLGSSQNTQAPQGNLYGDYGIGSAYYKDKLEMLKNGVHERTTAPYYYDPYTGTRMDLHKSKNYTAYNFKNDISSIKNFDLNNWLNDKATSFGNSLNNGLRDLFGGKSDFVQNPYIDEATGKWKNENNKVTEPGFTAAGEKGKTQVMVDNPNEWHSVEKPYIYDPQNAIDYENSKAGDFNKIQDMVDKIGNDEHQVTEKPFNYSPEGAVNYENSKAGGQYKIQDMVDKIGNDEHQVTEAPFRHDPMTAVDYENSKAGGQYKIQDMVDKIGNDEHQVTEKPFNYSPEGAVNYENSKAGGQYKIQDMVDKIGNDEHQVTEKPFNYSPEGAVNYENSKAGGQYKIQDMVDKIGNDEHQVTEAPFRHDPKEAVNYENSKAGGQYKIQDMVDKIGNDEHQVTEAPFRHDPMTAVDYENSKAGGQYKVQDMVDGIGNAEHEVTEAPFNYDPKNAVSYEQGKAGGQYKVQDMVDGIGNAEHEVTEAPFNYDPKEAVNYENSKAGGQYKVQDMVDGIGNAEHEVTEAPFNYDPKEAVNYENSKAGGQYKIQDMVDKIGNDEHEVTEAPFKHDPMTAVDYENSKAGGQYKIQDMVDKIGNDEHQVTEKPFNYLAKGAIDYEQSKKANT